MQKAKSCRIMDSKPFIKWVGGKGQLIQQLEELLPDDFSEREGVTYIEPFVGGGAMLFYMLQTYPNISSAVINDINPDLTTCYRMVRDRPQDLITELGQLQEEYFSLGKDEQRKEFYLEKRTRYNSRELEPIENSALFIFLNRTCFNGLYRVNKEGLFNVPFGRHEHPTICDQFTLLADSKLLQKVDILTGDFEQILPKVGKNTFFYFDPPYRPLSNTSSFNDYAREGFNDSDQERLKRFCDRITTLGADFMLSNSDCLSKDGTDSFFEELYSQYSIDRVWATRRVNSQASKRGKLSEILIRNYHTTAYNYRLDLKEV